MTASPVDLIDLVVVGGGPVGLATAIEARLAGLEVALVEPRTGPIDKACGEGLMPSALARLQALGVDPIGRPFEGIAYLDGQHRVEARFRRGPGRGVRRTALSECLVARAEDLGVRRVVGRVERQVALAGVVEVAGVRTRWLAAADGLHSPLRRSLGLELPGSGPPRYGLRRHYRVRAWSDVVEVHWATDAEAYVTPVSEDCVGVAVLCAGGGSYEDWLERFPQIVAQLGGATAASPVRGAGPLRQRVRSRRQGNVFLVGDAAGYVDALTGEGLAVGLESARLLVECLVAGRPGDYEARWRQVTRRSRLLTETLLWASRRPALRRRLVPAAARLPAVYRHAVEALS